METRPVGPPSEVHHQSPEFRQLTESLREESPRPPPTLLLFTGTSRAELRTAAEDLATGLGRPLLHVDLNAVSDKYIGETEKNLRESLARAEADDAILFFDEADALFGKRTEIKDAHDRYARIELSRVQEILADYAGIAIGLVQSPVDPARRWSKAKCVIVKFPPK
ncbi:MAG: AAA family ATPase [Pseudonocardiaceae bacterium]